LKAPYKTIKAKSGVALKYNLNHWGFLKMLYARRPAEIEAPPDD